MVATFIYRMSGAGHCARNLWAERTGVEGIAKPSWLNEAAEEGKEQEHIVKRRLIREGWQIEEGGICEKCKKEFKEVREGIHVEVIAGNIRLIGHMDGYAAKDGVKRILEVKSMSQYEFDRWMKGKFEEFPVYADQLTCYNKADGNNKSLYAVKNRNNGYLDITLLDNPPSDFKTIIQNIGRSTSKEMPNSNPDFNLLTCKRCAYKKLCVKPIEEMSVQTKAVLTKACNLWREGNTEAENGNTKINIAKETLMEHALATNLDKFIVNELAISLIKRNYTGYNRKKLEEMFTEKQLKPAFVDKPITPYLAISDLRKEE